MRVENDELLAELEKSRKQNRMTNRLAILFMNLVENYSRSIAWRQFHAVEECRSDAIMVLCSAWKSFDPTVGTNAFAYFSSVTLNAFKKRAAQEFKQSELVSTLTDIAMIDKYEFNDPFDSE